MHDHDLDLIAEFASGLLAEADEPRAAELVAACPVCAAEYETHQEIRALLAAEPASVLTEFERTRLRRGVLDALPAPRVGRATTWQRRWLAIAGVAATFFVLVGVAGVLDLFTTGDDSLFTTAEPAADSGSTPPAGLVPSTDDAMRALAADDHDGERSTEEAAEAAEVADAYGGALPFFVDAGEIADRTGLATVIDEVLAGVAESAIEVPVEDAVQFGAGCAPEITGPILGVVVAIFDGTPIQIFVTGERDDPQVIQVDGVACSPFPG